MSGKDKKTVYMLTYRHQITEGRNRFLKTANKSLYDLAKLICIGTTVTNKKVTEK
jgi:hypothetical protein